LQTRHACACTHVHVACSMLHCTSARTRRSSSRNPHGLTGKGMRLLTRTSASAPSHTHNTNTHTGACPRSIAAHGIR